MEWMSVNGDPIITSGRDFVTGLDGAEGAAIDPFTGDLLFSTFGGGNDQVVLVQELSTLPVPVPATIALLSIGLYALLPRRRCLSSIAGSC